MEKLTPTLLCMFIPNAMKPRNAPHSSLSILLILFLSLTTSIYTLYPSFSSSPSSSSSSLLNSRKMGSISADQHSLSPSYQKHCKDFLDIPPRKLISNKTLQENSDMSPYESNLHRFLPSNNLHNKCDDDDDDSDPYSSDHFRIYEFKVRRCTLSRSHDWTDCPFAHPGEKARRRDPRKYHYSGAACPEFRRGCCSRGESCEFAHGVFECWLHPSRYRTEACKDGRNCKRKVCFFAHTSRQLRILPEISSSSSIKNCHGGGGGCLACRSVISSPTSTLLGASHMSPPRSPVEFSQHSDRLSKLSSGLMSYKGVINEIMNSLEALNFHEVADGSVRNLNTNPWTDTCCTSNGDSSDHQQQFILSPSSPSLSAKNFFNGDCSRKGLLFNEKINNGDYSLDPDLGWVNELLK